jgi:hypothetical protein
MRFVDAFLITASGKARRSEMRRAMIGELGLIEVSQMHCAEMPRLANVLVR